MYNDKPFIYLFKTFGSCYAYDVNTNNIITITRQVWDMLQRISKETITEDNCSAEEKKALMEINKLRGQGLLSSKRIIDVEHGSTEILPYILNNRINTVTLQVTQQCNLRCEYCVYSGAYENRHHENKKMSMETAKKAIDLVLNRSKDTNDFHLAFYGGEPLLDFEFIKECMEYIKLRGQGKSISYGLTTNGTLLTEEIMDYFAEHKVQMLISLDGPYEIHNKNRKFAGNNKGTFDTVINNVEKLKVRHPEYAKMIMFNAVLDPENGFGCTNEFFTTFEVIKDSYSRASTYSTMNLKDESKVQFNQDYYKEIQYEYFKFFLFADKKLDEKYTSKLVTEYYSYTKDTLYKTRHITDSLPDVVHHSGPCMPGIKKLFVNVDGNIYPCERINENTEPLRIGHVDAGIDVNKVSDMINIGKLTKESCRNCWAIRYCKICAVAADDGTKLSKEAKLKHCEKTREDTITMLLDYCVLREVGHDFTKKDIVDLYEF
jgi:uncharacterized protein